MGEHHVGVGQVSTSINDESGSSDVSASRGYKEESAISDVIRSSSSLLRNRHAEFLSHSFLVNFLGSVLGSIFAVKSSNISKSSEAFSSFNSARANSIYSYSVRSPLASANSGQCVNTSLSS